MSEKATQVKDELSDEDYQSNVAGAKIWPWISVT